MAIQGRSTYFQNYEASGESSLIEDLIIEAISIYGQESFYLPRNQVEQDQLYSEAVLSKFETAYPLELYIKSVEGYEGQGAFMERFGLTIQDQMNVTVARRRFVEEIEEFNPNITRPREGDLIFLPWIKGALPNAIGKLFEVKFVKHDALFYQLGDLQTYDLSLETFEYSDERFSTGIPEIDRIEVDRSQSYLLDARGLTLETGLALTTESGQEIINDNYDKRTQDKDDDSTFFQDEGLEFIDFSEFNPFSENNF